MGNESRRSKEVDGRETCDSIRDRLSIRAAQFDSRFDAYLTAGGDVPSDLLDAMRYSALAPGKRIRPYLVTECCELVGGNRDDAWPAAAAIECVHAFSLIHDDLPAMDDDCLRRGLPSCHKKYGEALAILAGDALLALSFELLMTHVADRGLGGEMALELARGAGWSGMIGGQTADVLGENQPPSLDLTKYVHERKTASLFRTACRLGALAGHGKPEHVAALGRYGQHLGQAFQIADDLLDVTSSADAVGKSVGKDLQAGKQTFPRCMGVERSKAAALEEASLAAAELDMIGPGADDLRSLAEYVVYRNY